MAAKKPTSSAPKMPLVALVGGPFDRFWYTETEWHERVATEARMLPFEDRQAVLALYQPDGTAMTSPEWPDVTAPVWRWTGT